MVVFEGAREQGSNGGKGAMGKYCGKWRIGWLCRVGQIILKVKD